MYHYRVQDMVYLALTCESHSCSNQNLYLSSVQQVCWFGQCESQRVEVTNEETAWPLSLSVNTLSRHHSLNIGELEGNRACFAHFSLMGWNLAQRCTSGAHDLAFFRMAVALMARAHNLRDLIQETIYLVDTSIITMQLECAIMQESSSVPFNVCSWSAVLRRM